MPKNIKAIEFELSPLIQLMDVINSEAKNKMRNTKQYFEGVPCSEKERKKQKDGIISESKDKNYQIIKRNGEYYGRIIL